MEPLNISSTFLTPSFSLPLEDLTYRQFSDLNERYNATRSQRIRAAMFPETMAEGDYSSAGAGDVGQSQNVQRLAEPSQLLKNAVVNLINYQVGVLY